MPLVQIGPSPAGATREQPHFDVQMKLNWADAWASAPAVKYVEPVSWTKAVPPSTGQAELRYWYGRQTREDAATLADEPPIDFTDAYIRILRTNSLGTRTLWTGIVAHQAFDIQSASPTGEPSGCQRLVAYGLGHLLDRIPVQGAFALQGGSVVEIGWEPEFNGSRRVGPGLSGNRSAAWQGSSYVFSDEGTTWTNRDVVEYLLDRFAPSVLPIVLAGQADLLSNIVTTHRLGGRTLWQALDHLIPRRRGLGWRLDVADDGTIAVHVFSLLGAPLSVGAITIDANPDQYDLALDDIIDVKSALVELATTLEHDRVVVRGNRPIVCFTTSFADSNLEPAWTAAEEAAYTAGAAGAAKGEPDAHDAERKLLRHRRVYQAFRIPAAWDWLASDGIGGGPNSLVDFAFDDQGYAVLSSTPTYWHTAERSLLRHLPLLKPAAATGAAPEFREPLVIVKDPSASVWHDISRLANEEGHKLGGAVRVLPAEMALEVRPAYNHVLGLNHFDPADGATGDATHPPLFDYTSLIATVACETDHPLQAVAQRPGSVAHETDRTLVLSLPDAHYWRILPGTVIGVANGGLVHQPADLALRDDGDRVRAAAALAMAYYGELRARIQLNLQVLWDGLPLGGYVRNISSSWHREPVGSVVTAVTHVNAEPPQTIIETGYAELDIAEAFDIPGHSDARSLGRTLTEHAEQLAEIRRELGDPPVDHPEPPVKPGFWAQVVATAPAGETIPADGNIYAVRKVRDPNVSGDTGDGVNWEFDTAHPLHVMATNVAENKDAHGLHEDDTADDTDAVIVWVTHVRDQGGPPARRYLFRRGIVSAVDSIEAASAVKVENGSKTYGDSNCILEIDSSNATVYEARWLFRFPDGHRPLKGSAILGYLMEAFRAYVKDPTGATGVDYDGIFDIELLTADYDPGTVAWGDQPGGAAMGPRRLTVELFVQNATGWAEADANDVDLAHWAIAGHGVADTDYYGLRITPVGITGAPTLHDRFLSVIPDIYFNILIRS